MSLINVSELPRERLAEARVLAGLGGSVSEAEWARCCGGEHRWGMLGAEASSGVLLGFASYRAGSGDDGRPVLRVGLFVAFELMGNSATAAALCDSLEQVRTRLGCTAILFEGQASASGMVEPA